MIMAVAVATCSPTMNARYGDSALDTSRSCAHDPPMIAGMSTAWPRLEMGNNSVMPCRSPMTPASAYVRCDMPALRSPRWNPRKPENQRSRTGLGSSPQVHVHAAQGICSGWASARPPVIVAGPRNHSARFHVVFMGGGRPPLGLAGHLRGVLAGPAADFVAQPDQRVVLAADHPLLHRDQRIVGDLDVLRAHLGAALGDVAVAKAEIVLGDLAPVGGVGRVHLEFGDAHQEPGARERALVLRMVADHVAGVLAQEALNAL